MGSRRVLLYFSWSRPAEISAPIAAIEDRFPALFELRRLYYPKYEHLSEEQQVDQGIGGFLNYIQKPNFQLFAQLAEEITGNPVAQIERIGDDGETTLLTQALVGRDTVVVISFDSLRTGQTPSSAEVDAIRRFLDTPDHLVFVCPHHDIGESEGFSGQERIDHQFAEYRHHGDHAIPPRQGFGGFARALLAALGVPVENRYGLRPAAGADGAPAPAEIYRALDELGLLRDVEALNLHPHLPQLERIASAHDRMQVLARQRIDLTAPAHPFTQSGRWSFDAVLQSRPSAFAGTLVVCDTTMFSSTAGGVENLRRFWTNTIRRPRRV